MRPIAFGLLVLLTLLAGSRRTEAGPPCICWPIEIGEARSLPWGDAEMTTDAEYDVERLVPDVLRILDERASPFVRMETLRRATIYLMRAERKQSRIAWQLFARLAARTMDDTAQGRHGVLPWFDASYLLAAYGQVRLGDDWPGTDGWQSVFLSRATGEEWSRGERAAALREMNVGVALTKYMGEGDAWKPHVLRALDGAEEGTLLARNVLRLFGREGETLDALRARLR